MYYSAQNIMVQKYIPGIEKSGDKRIILIDGNPVPVALARIPSPGNHRGNMVTGARVELRPHTDRDIWICKQIGHELLKRSLLFTVIDNIGDYLTEVNVTSPTGIRELERGGGYRATGLLFDAIESKLN